MLSRISVSSLVVGAVIIAGSAVTASAQDARLVAGTLTCRGNGSIGLILGSSQRMDCVFERVKGGPRANYTARITRIGLDLGIKGRNTMVWTVLSSTDNPETGALAGRYAGVAANAAVGVGSRRKCAHRRIQQLNRPATAERPSSDGCQRGSRCQGSDTQPLILIYYNGNENGDVLRSAIDPRCCPRASFSAAVPRMPYEWPAPATHRDRWPDCRTSRNTGWCDIPARRTVHHLGFGQSNGFENCQRDVDDVVKLGAQFTVTGHTPLRPAYCHRPWCHRIARRGFAMHSIDPIGTLSARTIT